MLYSFEGNRVNRNPHHEQFEAWCHGILSENLQAIRNAINDFCDQNNEFRSSFIPGKDETIQNLFPHLTAACGGDEEQAGLFFGNIVWRVIDSRADEWYFKRSDRDDEHPLGTFYWQRNLQN